MHGDALEHLLEGIPILAVLGMVAGWWWLVGGCWLVVAGWWLLVGGGWWCCAVGGRRFLTHPAVFVFGGGVFVSGYFLEGCWGISAGAGVDFSRCVRNGLIFFFRPGVRREVTTGLAED
jgi:hypothetical protein